MLSSEGYKMFRGSAWVVPTNPRFPPENIFGDWLYKPEYDCWYVRGRSYPSEIVQDICEEDNTGPAVSEIKAKINALSDLVVNSKNSAEIAAAVERLRRDYC